MDYPRRHAQSIRNLSVGNTSSFHLVVTKLDRYGDLGRDKSFPFTQRDYGNIAEFQQSINFLILFLNFPNPSSLSLFF